jgi:TolB protein
MTRFSSKHVRILLVGLGPSLVALPAAAQQDSVLFIQQVEWSPEGGRIAFAGMKVSKARWEQEQWEALSDTQYDIYIMNADGGDERRLTTNPGYDLWLSWSPDSRRIAFSSDRDGNTDLYAMDPDGSNLVRLTSAPGRESAPSWSPDGRRIVYMAKEEEEPWQIWIMDADGSDRKRLVESEADDANPVFSPDGSRIAFFTNRAGRGQDQVFVANSDGTEAHAVAPGVFPGWAPDGAALIYGHEGLNVIDLNGTNPRKLLADAFGFGRWSPDGKRIAYVGGEPPDTGVYVMSADGTATERITE